MAAIKKKERLTGGRFLAVILALVLPFSAGALDFLEQIPVSTFGKMREVERYQIKVAEKERTVGTGKKKWFSWVKFRRML